MRYPEIYYSDEVKRILNSKPPLPDAPKMPKDDSRFYKPDNNGETLQGISVCVLSVGVVLIILSIFVKTTLIGLIGCCTSIISFFMLRSAISKKREYEKQQMEYLAMKKEFNYKYDIYHKEEAKYNETVNELMTDSNIEKFRKEKVNEYLTTRQSPLFSDCETDIAKKGISENFFTELLSKEFTVYANKRIKVGNSFYYPDILLIHNNIFIDIEIDEPYSNDDGAPIHYICNEERTSVDDDRNEFFTKQGFEVIRFAERQVVMYPIECIILIKNLISKIELTDSKIAIQRDFFVHKWTKEEANNMAKARFRETYIADVGILNMNVRFAQKGIGDLFVEMAKVGNSVAQFNVALLYYYGVQGMKKNYKRMVEWYKKSAEQGNMRSQVNLGDCYYYGIGISQDYEKAVEWYVKSANQGSAKAQFKLGSCYYNGKGVSLDYVIAVKYYEKSATQNNTDALYKLGDCYYYGKGIIQDEDHAVCLYQKASDLGHKSAQLSLGLYYYNRLGTEPYYKKAVKLFAKLAQNGDATAMFYLGECYHKSRGISQNSFLAAAWYKDAAEEGNENALLSLAECYYRGDGVQQDKNKAIECWTNAANNGNVTAQMKLAFFYSNKKESSFYDNEKAVKWFSKAAEFGNAEAQYNLGICYYEGKGVIKDYEKAVEWHSKAAKHGYFYAQKWLREHCQ